jgi:hypothetical protein
VSAPVDCVPVVALLPLQAPDAVQEEVLVDDHDSVALLPLATVPRLALKLTVGAGGVTVTWVVCAALPPAPLQVKV